MDKEERQRELLIRAYSLLKKALAKLISKKRGAAL
jgi:hypothetical protein